MEDHSAVFDEVFLVVFNAPGVKIRNGTRNHNRNTDIIDVTKNA